LPVQNEKTNTICCIAAKHTKSTICERHPRGASINFSGKIIFNALFGKLFANSLEIPKHSLHVSCGIAAFF
jgi:hypothetical protein